MEQARVVIVGAGAAGLALAVQLAARRVAGVVLVEAPPGPLQPTERTWCSWQTGSAWWTPAVSARWTRAEVQGHTGPAAAYELAPLTYTMVRSRDYEALAGALLGGVERVVAAVTAVRPDGTVEGAGVRGDAVFDTRPVVPGPASVSMLQHFRGWFVRTAADAFDPAVAGLMDFRPPQPPGGVAFGYVLPTSPREALVEYTEFSREALTAEGYEAALNDYCTGTLGLSGFEVVATEQGAIPMTDGDFPRRVSERVFRLGTAGGATRPSTGYTFAGAQRQASAVAEALAAGRDPEPPAAYGRRHLAMDRLMLQALDRGALDGAAFFSDLFRRQPTERVLRFLDGTTSLREDLAVMASAPRAPMVRTALRLAR